MALGRLKKKGRMPKVAGNGIAGTRRRYPGWLKPVGGAAGLVLLTLIAYSTVIDSGGWIWDDDSYILNNPHLADPGGLKAIWADPSATPQYYPMVFTTLWAQYQLWGTGPASYHLGNVLLYAAGVVLLWWVLRRLGIRGGWLAAAIVAVHPMHVESVAWVTERKNVLAVLFYLATALVYFRFDQPEADRSGSLSSPKRWSLYPLVVLLFACALLSKSITATLPGAVLVVLWWKRSRLRLGDVAPLIPLLLLGAAAGLHTAWLEAHQVGAAGAEWSLGPAERVMLAGCTSWFYVGKLIWPATLTFIYPRWTIELSRWWLFVFPMLVLAVPAGLWLARKRIGKGPLAAVLFYLVTLFPAMGFLNVYPMRYSYVADHFAYPATVGLIALGAAGVAVALDRLRGRWRAGLIAACAMALLTGIALSNRQERNYHDAESLWLDTLAKNPDCWMCHSNLGKELNRQGRLGEAIEHFSEAIRMRPNFVEAISNRGSARSRLGDTAGAIEDFSRAIDIGPVQSAYYCNRGAAYRQLGQIDKALKDLTKSIELGPPTAIFYYQRGVAYMFAKRFNEAVEDFDQAIRLDGGFFAAYDSRGDLYRATGREPQAMTDFNRAIALAPNSPNAYGHRALLYMQTGDLARARQDALECRRLGGLMPAEVESLIR